MSSRNGGKERKNVLYLTLLLTMVSVFFSNVTKASAASIQPDNGASFETVISEAIQPTNEAVTLSPTVSPEPTLTPDKEVEPTPTAALEPTLSPDEAVTPTPTGAPEPTLPPDGTVTPTPSDDTTPSITPSPTPVPYRSRTLPLMAEYDYIGKSVTGITKKKESVKALNKKVKKYGTLYGTGMPLAEYKSAMGYHWVDMTEYNKEPVTINVDITKTMDYDTYVNILKKLSRYEGVFLYKIGKSTEGRDLYSIEIDMESTSKKKVFMLTGQVHAREFAGGTYIVKQFVDLVQKAQTDEKTMELLKNNKFVAVPIINVDGREALIKSPSKWTTQGKQLWKAYTNGTDGNRNFPGLQWGQVANGKKMISSISKKPAYANYVGDYAGSNSETKAMMKWIYHYTIVEQADFYLDMHQQGSIIYAGKTWQTKKQEQRCQDLRTGVLNVINKGSSKRKYGRVYESSLYGIRGEGSSLTDYAVSLAVGAKFSPAYGFSVFTDGKKEYPLLQVKDLDKKTVQVKEANKNFAAITVEIGYGTSYLGNSASTRKLLAKEYNNYYFDQLLEALSSIAK